MTLDDLYAERYDLEALERERWGMGTEPRSRPAYDRGYAEGRAEVLLELRLALESGVLDDEPEPTRLVEALGRIA